MAKAWYEEDDNESIWRKATRKNAQRVCPDAIFSIAVGDFGYNMIKNLKNVKSVVGFLTELKVIAKAGIESEKEMAILAAAGAYCTGAYMASGLDAWYQIEHGGSHFGLDVWDFDVQGTVNLLAAGYNKFEQDAHQIEFLLNNIAEWWRA